MGILVPRFRCLVGLGSRLFRTELAGTSLGSKRCPCLECCIKLLMHVGLDLTRPLAS